MAYMGQFKDGYKMQSYDYPIITIPPKENMLLVFPSWVPHAVETNLSNEDRISLSFNFNYCGHNMGIKKNRLRTRP